ncbi:DNA replication protein DnaC [Bradyrhizobium sp. USDA 3051]
MLYKRAPRLFADLAQARAEGRLARLIATLERVNLLILDDWGPEPLTAETSAGICSRLSMIATTRDPY